MNTATAQASETRLRQDRRKPSLRTRLHAWWEGIEVQVPPERQQPAAPEPAPVETYPDDPLWSEERVEVAQLLWGDDATDPGGPRRVWEMVKPLGLDSTKTLLDLNAGTGGAARLIAQKCGAWVTGMVPSETLARVGAAKSTAAGLSKKAPVQGYDPDSFELPRRSFDAVVSNEMFFTARKKQALFSAISDALKTGGQLVFTDYLLREPGLEEEDAVKRWVATEPVTPTLWSVEEVVHYLRSLGLDVRITEDVTDEYRAEVLVGMTTLQERRREIHKLDDATAELLIAEAEMWAARIAALDSDCVRVYRIYARKLDTDDGTVRTLSDW